MIARLLSWRVVNWVCGVVLLLWLVPTAFTARIGPGEVGARRGATGAVHEGDLEPGYALAVPFWHRMFVFDATVHAAALEIEARPDAVATVTLLYRPRPGDAWRTVAAGRAEDWEAGVRAAATKPLRAELARRPDAELCDGAARAELNAALREAVDAALAPQGAEAVALFVDRVRLSGDEEHRRAARVDHLWARTGDARRRALEVKKATAVLAGGVERDVATVDAEGARQVEKTRARLTLEIARIEAEAALRDRERRAAADAVYGLHAAEARFIEARAHARGDRRRAEALDTPAGRMYTAIEAARHFELGELSSGPLDPATLHRFGSIKAWRAFFLE